MVRHRYFFREILGRFGVTERLPHRDDARPHVALSNVVVVVGGSTGPRFHRRLVHRKRQYRGRSKLLPRMRTQMRAPSGDHLIDYRVQRPNPFIGVLHSAGPADYDGTSVIHRMVECRSSKDESVDDGRSDADVLLGSIDHAA